MIRRAASLNDNPIFTKVCNITERERVKDSYGYKSTLVKLSGLIKEELFYSVIIP